MAADELIVDFYSMVGRISKLGLNEELKNHSLHRQANLDIEDCSVAISFGGGDYPLQALGANLQNVFETNLHSPG